MYDEPLDDPQQVCVALVDAAGKAVMYHEQKLDYRAFESLLEAASALGRLGAIILGGARSLGEDY